MRVHHIVQLTIPLAFGPVVLAASLLAVPTISAAADPATSDTPAYVVPQTETWELVVEGGEPYSIFVSRPTEAPPDEGFPVLYVLDGNAYFASFAEARRIQEGKCSNKFAKPSIGNSLIVGVGYQTDMPYDVRRLYDFTPPLPDPPPPVYARFTNVPTGGHDRFLGILVNELRTEVARRYPVDPHRQALYGHSLGGLFALHVLYTRPDAFHAIIAASPALAWNSQEILAEERAFANRLSNAEIEGSISRVLLLVGEHEETTVSIWDTTALARRLEPLSTYGLRSRFEILDGEVHVTVPSRSVTSTLRFAFSWP